MSQGMNNLLSLVIVSFFVYMLFFKDKNKKKNNNIHNERSNEESKLLESNIDKKIGITSIEDLESNHLINEEKKMDAVVENEKYIKPSKNLLEIYPQKESNDEEIINKSNTIDETLRDFKVNAKVCNVNIGSQASVYEIQLIGNTRVQKVMELENDLKMSLGEKNIKMFNPVPGKPTIGVEVPNKSLTIIGLRQILKDIPNSKKIIVLGKDFYNNSHYIKLENIKNVLVCGRHDSGKTMFLNNIIITMLLKLNPDELKMVIIDPKRVEFNMYNGIPHLLTPVITDTNKAITALQKLSITMNDRFETFKMVGVKNIEAYNEYIDKILKNEPECGLKKMPIILVIIDELADLIVNGGNQVKELLSSIIQHCNSAGIHFVISTQRPSIDIICNDIKINFPNRISFDVSSSIDSKVILDTVGSENLFGNGDMMCRIVEHDELLRLQAPFISDNEITKIVDFVKEKNKKVVYEKTFSTDSISKSKTNEKEEQKDVLYDEILNYAIRMGQISTSIIQRKYAIGYNRATRIMDLFEERGIVGPAKGSKPRDVLVKYEKDDN